MFKNIRKLSEFKISVELFDMMSKNFLELLEYKRLSKNHWWKLMKLKSFLIWKRFSFFVSFCLFCYCISISFQIFPSLFTILIFSLLFFFSRQIGRMEWDFLQISRRQHRPSYAPTCLQRHFSIYVRWKVVNLKYIFII